MGSVGERQYPLKKPAGHKPPVPRWTLKLPADVSHLYTLYIGVQGRDGESVAGVELTIERNLNDGADGPAAIDTFRVTDGFDIRDSRVWVAYWTSADDFQTKVNSLRLHDIWQGLGSSKRSIGLWSEHFTTPVDRLETNYARLDHKPVSYTHLTLPTKRIV